jgi:hypothetical protein
MRLYLNACAIIYRVEDVVRIWMDLKRCFSKPTESGRNYEPRRLLERRDPAIMTSFHPEAL